MEAINVILRFLDQRLSKVEVRKTNFSSRRSTSLRSGSEKCQRHALSRSSTSHRDVSIESNDSQILSTTDFTTVDRRSASFADRRTKITEQVGRRSERRRRILFSSRFRLIRLMTNPNTDLKTLAAKLLFVLCKENGETIDDAKKKNQTPRISFQLIDSSNTRATATLRVSSTTTVSTTPDKIILWNNIPAIRTNPIRRCTRVIATITSNDRLTRSFRILHSTFSFQFGSGDRSGQYETA